MQVDPQKYKGIFNGFSVTLKEDGVRGLAKGWAPTFIGYSMQGLCKFGFYEVFKVLYSNMLERRMPICGAHHYIWLPLLVLNSLLTLPWLQWKLLRFEFKPSQVMPTH